MCSIIGIEEWIRPKGDFFGCFDRTLSRGPDMSRVMEVGNGLMGFHRLAIMGLTEEGMQPFSLGENPPGLQRGNIRLPSAQGGAFKGIYL